MDHDSLRELRVSRKMPIDKARPYKHGGKVI